MLNEAVEYAIEEDGRAYNAYIENAYQENVLAGWNQKIDLNITVKELLDGMKQQAKDGMKPSYGTAPRKREVDILHMSPPCQPMSKVNMHANMATINKSMVPLLDQCVEMVREVELKFVTLEEVPTFLMHKVKKEDKDGSPETEACIHSCLFSRAVRCIWRILLPLLDMGYQVDIRMLNAAHFAVPQCRLRLILWAAKSGYMLPTPPSPWTHYAGKKPGVQHDSALRMRMQWNDLAVTSDAAHAKEPLPPALTARDAIHDLPLHVEASFGTQTFKYIKHVEEPSVLAKFLRREQNNRAGFLFNNWMPEAASNTEKCLRKASERSSYNKPFPTICGSTSHHAAHNLCPRPGTNRLISVAERKRFQGFPDHTRLGGPVTAQIQQVGNAVPPLLAWAILGSVFSAAYGVEAPKPQFVLDMQRAETEAAAYAAEERNTMQSIGNLLEHLKNLATLEDRHMLCLSAEARDHCLAIRSVLQTRTSPREEDPPAVSRAPPQKCEQPRPATPAGGARKLPRVGERRNTHRVARPGAHARQEEAIVSSTVAACSLLGAPASGMSPAHDMAATAEASADTQVVAGAAVTAMARGSAAELLEPSVHGAAGTSMSAVNRVAPAAAEAADLYEARDFLMTDAHEEPAVASLDPAVPVSSALAMLRTEAAAVPVGECASEEDTSAAAAADVLAAAGDLGQDTTTVEEVASLGEGSATATRHSRGQKRKATDILDTDTEEEAEEFNARAHVVRGMAVLLRTNDDSDIGWDKVWSFAHVNRHDKKKGKLNVTWLKPASLEDPWAQRWRDWTVEMTNKKGQTYEGIWRSHAVDIDTVQWGTRMRPDGFFQEQDREVLCTEVQRMEAVLSVLPN
ncbi:g8682 [Coccomyxa elongata]